MAPLMSFSGDTKRYGRRSRRPVSDINVTPFVDVMLVLLVVFMVTAPMLTVAVPVDLPETQARTVNQDKDPLIVTVREDGRIYLQDKTVPFSRLAAKLRAVSGANPDVRIFVRGDKALAYGRIMEVMGAINEAGFTKVALVAELPQDSGPGDTKKP
ncbi:MAG: protein TolR [Alphaproteobacteria bacterium]|nr:protein TolR [Alphaproteobacteria bacterium]